MPLALWQLMTANCVPIVSTNNLATNGVVHVVDEALPSPNMTLLEMIKTDPQFSILRTRTYTVYTEPCAFCPWNLRGRD